MRTLSPDAASFLVKDEPFYQPVGDEVAGFERAWRANIPVLLKGPTGCGKTRFVSHMAHKLGRPLITVACHEDLTSSDLVGRYVLEGDETVWIDGPLTAAVRLGAILYLDEVVEARKDTMVVIHPLADHRRSLLIDKLGEVLHAAEGFMLVMSYNPGYQSLLKDLKPFSNSSTWGCLFRAPRADASISGRLAGSPRILVKAVKPRGPVQPQTAPVMPCCIRFIRPTSKQRPRF